MRYSHQPIGSDDDSGTSSDALDVFSDGAADDILESTSKLASSDNNLNNFNNNLILDNKKKE
jgi:hypothetical protein